MFAFQSIVILLLIAGFIAYIGDKVGQIIGKKRLLLFGLRPRYSAIAITILTGILIAAFTGTILSVLSSDVRTALFGLDKLKAEIDQKSSDLKKIINDKQILFDEIEKAKKEIAALNTAKKQLYAQVKLSQSGVLLFKVDDIITSTLIKTSEEREDVENKLKEILATTDSGLKEILGPKKKHYIVIPNVELEEAVDFILNHPGQVIVRVVAAKNIVQGENVPVHFELFENLVVFNKGEEITSAIVNGQKKLPEIEQDIKDLLSQVNNIAKKKGILPDASGSVGTISYSKIFEMAKSIKSKNKLEHLKIISAKDIYSIGPLEIEIKAEE